MYIYVYIYIHTRFVEYGSTCHSKHATSCSQHNCVQKNVFPTQTKIFDTRTSIPPKITTEPYTPNSHPVQHGPKKWSLIASFLPGRIGKQCRER